MKVHMLVNFKNDGLQAQEQRHYDVDDSMSLKSMMDMLVTDADDIMRDYCEDEDDEEENLGGTEISILQLW